jgi:hypothetical protein
LGWYRPLRIHSYSTQISLNWVRFFNRVVQLVTSDSCPTVSGSQPVYSKWRIDKIMTRGLDQYLTTTHVVDMMNIPSRLRTLIPGFMLSTVRLSSWCRQLRGTIQIFTT